MLQLVVICSLTFLPQEAIYAGNDMRVRGLEKGKASDRETQRRQIYGPLLVGNGWNTNAVFVCMSSLPMLSMSMKRSINGISDSCTSYLFIMIFNRLEKEKKYGRGLKRGDQENLLKKLRFRFSWVMSE